MPDDRQPIVNQLLKYVWNLPNEVIGKGLGYAGHGIGTAAHAVGLQKDAPRIEYDRERRMTNFINSPLSPMGALTVGHNTLYTGNPYDQKSGSAWAGWGERIFDHERAHVPQGELLGPLYLPSNLAGGLISVLRDSTPKEPLKWDGPSNWNERGPNLYPPRPWPERFER